MLDVNYVTFLHRCVHDDSITSEDSSDVETLGVEADETSETLENETLNETAEVERLAEVQEAGPKNLTRRPGGTLTRNVITLKEGEKKRGIQAGIRA